MKKFKKKYFLLLFLLLSFAIPVTMAAVTYYLDFSASGTVSEAVVQFTSAGDTSSISGSIGSNGSSFTTSSLPLVAGVEIIIDEAVNITNSDSSAHTITFELLTEDFGTDCTNITIAIVEADGTENLAIYIDGSGVVQTSSSGGLSLPASTDWAVKMYITMDAGIDALARSITCHLSYT